MCGTGVAPVASTTPTGIAPVPSDPGVPQSSLGAMGRAVGAIEAAVEAEIVVIAGDGRPHAELLDRRDTARSDSARRRMAQDHPVTVFVTDLLWLEGHATEPLPFRDRRRLLEQLELEGPHWRTVTAHPGDGDALLAATADQDLPGVIARRLDGPYGDALLISRT